MAIDFTTEAWRVLARWLDDHHPEDEEDDGEFFGIFEAVDDFNKWALTNSIDKYLDANQPASSLSSGVSDLTKLGKSKA